MNRACGARRSDTAPMVASLRGGAHGVGSTLPIPAPWPTLPTTTAPSVDFRSYVPRIEDQGQRDACVGFAFENARRIAVKSAGSLGSPIDIYVGARVRERARKTDPIPDTGCMPADAADHLVSVGVCRWDARDDVASLVNTENTWVESVGSQKLSMDDMVAIVAGDVDTLDRWLTWAMLNGSPLGATFAMDVDASYQQLSAKSPVWTGMTSKSLGGHDQCVVGYMPMTGVGRCYIVQNSWSDSWGDGGYSYIPRSTFANVASEIILVKSGPVLS